MLREHTSPTPSAHTDRLHAQRGGFAGQGVLELGRVWRSTWQLAPGVGGLVGALVVWRMSLSGVDIRAINDYGLLSVLPASFLIALGLLVCASAATMALRRPPELLLFAQVVAYILIVHGTPILLYETPRYAWTFKHIGVTEYIQRYGSVDPHLGIYFNWPGFFALSALITQIAGFDTAFAFAPWAPVFFNVLNVLVLLLLFRALTRDTHHVWQAIWLFSLTNWIGQDYFAPQALSYFLHLLIIAICVMWLRDTPVSEWLLDIRIPLSGRSLRLSDDTRCAERAQPAQQMGLVALILLCFSAIVASHQLTPFFTIISVAALVAARQCRVRSLPLLMALMTTGWIVYIAHIYAAGALGDILVSVTRIFANIRENVTDLSSSTPGRAFVALSCRAVTLVLWCLALLGVAYRLRYRRLSRAATLLAFVPFLMLPIQAYGGEMLFRVYFFSQPFMAWLGATLIAPGAGKAMRWPNALAGALLSAALLAGTLFAYYGNERMNTFSNDELAAANYIYAHADDGALVMTADLNTPLGYRDYERFVVSSLTAEGYQVDALGLPGVSDVVALLHTKEQRDAYLLITRSQKQYISLFSLMPDGFLDRLEYQLAQSPQLELVFENRDARVYKLVRGTSGERK